MNTLLEAKSLSHTFDYTLFNDVSLMLHSRESIAIIGKSGSGKSTLLNILSTLLNPTSGDVELIGNSVKNLSIKKLSSLRRDNLGLIFQTHYLFKGFSAYENLEVASLLSGTKIEKELLKRLGIYDVIEQKVTELSGGQQQRVSIARVLTKEPKIIFADEPTGNLDQKSASEVMDVLFEYILKNGAGLILVTHDEVLAHRCSRVYRLIEGKLVNVK